MFLSFTLHQRNKENNKGKGEEEMKKKVEELMKEITEFCYGLSFSNDQLEYIRKSLIEAYLAGVIDTLQEQLVKTKQK